MPRLSKIGAAALAAFGWTSGSSVTASYLVVAGGGGGGSGESSRAGGGGGAGGLLSGTATLNPTLSYTVTVGAGGVGGVDVTSNSNTSGSNSVFNAVTSTGGGAGGTTGTLAGQNGGSGGGGSNGSAAGTGVSGQGSAGGVGQSAGNSYGGGGGGASAVGTNGSSGVGGTGGAGTASSITGSSVTYAGGGGGGLEASGTQGAGGAGGGGTGNNGTGTNAASGTANLGGGGGGAGKGTSGAAVNGGKGGSGVVIISYVGAQQFGGGTVTSSGGNTIHTFTTSGTLSPLSSLTAQYLVVAGGGGGTRATGSGGSGAGGYRTGTGLVIDINSNYVITVGAGGAGATTDGVTGSSGGSSAFLATTSAGGGAGGHYAGSPSGTGFAGGSGGGGDSQAGPKAGGASSPVTSPVQGYAGGAGSGQGGTGGNYSAGGGGGAGAVGATAVTNGGNGGVGVANSISGTSTYYAGGGGGGAGSGFSGGTGGNGGGGNGGVDGTSNGTSGTENLGGGAGGNRYAATAASNGGSGVVIISYPGATQQMAGGTVTISGGNVIHTFTSSGYLTPIKYASRSLRFRSTNNAYLTRTPTVAGNRKTWTWSGWVKRGTLTTAQYLFTARSGSPWGGLVFDATATDSFQVTFTAGVSGGTYTSAFYRDPSAWYHIVAAIDTTQATAADRIKVYVNGVQITSFSSTNYPSQNFDTQFNSTIAHYLGCSQSNTENFDGYMTEVNFVDGAALTPSSFGTFNSYGVWQPITYGGSYGTNGFYLTFGNNTSTTTLGYDTSPQGNNWTTNNISVTAGVTYDSMLDVPTLTSATVANYCTYNPLDFNSDPTISNGNLQIATTGTGNPGAVKGTLGVSTGKWYWEITQTAGAARGNVGIILSSTQMTQFPGNYSTAYIYNGIAGNKYNNGTATAYGASYTVGDVIGVALDMDAGTIVFYKNNSSQGTAFTGLSGIFTPVVSDTGGGSGGFAVTLVANFGQQPFTYTPPSGFVALNTYNLSTPTIPNGAVYMAATTYTGTGATQVVANTVNGTAMQPDWVWLKSRSVARDHRLMDTNRGINNILYSDLTIAEAVGSALSSVNSNGFTLNTTDNQNIASETYIAWQWKANAGTNVTNTSGSITSTVSANTTAGFSVVIWTGGGSAGTIGHGLGVTPGMIIIKNRSGTQFWFVNHTSISTTQNLYLNDTAAVQSDGIFTSRGATTFGVGTGVAGSATNYVAYIFAPIAGFSAFGSYTGNGSTDGPFVFLGFRPRWVMFKRTDSTDDWIVFDTSRNTYDVMNSTLFPNGNYTETTDSNRMIDSLSNGFKVRSSPVYINASGGTYIYMAFAENPFKYANAR